MATSDIHRKRFQEALDQMDELPRGDAPAQKAARRIAVALGELGIPYVVAGGLAVAAHGHMRATLDVDLILTASGLETFKARWLGRGWVERFKGSKGLRDAVTGIKVDILTPDEKPGDGVTAPMHFPDPGTCGEDLGGIWAGVRVLSLPMLIELKLASGMTSPGRPRDLDDVIRLIEANNLEQDYAEQLHPFVQSKFRELHGYAASSDEQI